ncbi:MAG: CBS domain-containing protein [Thermodesulfobacteriales bacterium]
MIENKSLMEIMTKDVLTVHTKQKLSDVTRIFRENSIHHLPVLNGKKPVGMISSQDVFKLVFNIDATDQRMLDSILDSNYSIEDTMTKKLVIFDDALTIKDATKILGEGSFHSVIVVDNKGDLNGIVTTTDLIRYLHNNITS